MGDDGLEEFTAQSYSVPLGDAGGGKLLQRRTRDPRTRRWPVGTVALLVLALASAAGWFLIDERSDAGPAAGVASEGALAADDTAAPAPPDDPDVSDAGAVSSLLPIDAVRAGPDEAAGPFPWITGRVLSEHGRPIGSATVTVRRIAKAQKGLAPESLDPIGSTTTDDHGRYHWGDEAHGLEGETVLLSATAPGHGQATLVSAFPTDGVEVADIVLEEARVLRFQLLAADGKPGIGVDAALWPLDPLNSMRWSLAHGRDEDIPPPLHTAVTDAEGRVSLPVDPAHASLVLFGREEGAILPLVVEEPSWEETVVDWSPPGALTGEVVDDAGEPVPGAELLLEHRLPEIPVGGVAHTSKTRRPRGWFGETARADAEGRFSLGTRSPYVHVLRATKHGHRAARESLKGLTRRVSVTLERTEAIEVVVLHQDTDQLVDASLAIHREGPFGWDAGAAVHAGAHVLRVGAGRFELVIDRHREVDVVATAHGYTPSLASVDYPSVVRRQEQEGRPFRIRLWPGSRVEGSVTGARGRPVEAARIELVDSPRRGMLDTLSSKPPVAVTASSERGEFAFEALPEGRFRLRAFHPDYAPHESEAFWLAGRTGLEVMDVQLAAAGSLSVEVVDAVGLPVEGAWVGATPRSRSMAMPTGFGWADDQTDAEGRATFDGLEPGPWIAMARLPNEDEREMRLLTGAQGILAISVREAGPEADRIVEVLPGAATPVSLVLGVRPEMGCRLSGRLLGLESGDADAYRVRWSWSGQDSPDSGQGPYAGPRMGPVEPVVGDVMRDGRFDLGVVRAGKAHVEVLRGDRVLSTPHDVRWVELPLGGRRHLDIDLPWPRRVLLRVLAPGTGAPLTEGSVSWHDQGDPQESGRAGLHGGAHELDLATGVWSFRIEAPGWAAISHRIEIPGGVGLHPVDLISEASIEWEAYLVNPRGRPVRRAQVVPLRRENPAVSVSAPQETSDNDGRVVFTKLPADRYRVRVVRPNPMGPHREVEIDLDLTSPSGETVIVPD